jgi:LytR cell envelope-related transcriptional attenuator
MIAALSLLAGGVWWQVLHRPTASTTSSCGQQNQNVKAVGPALPSAKSVSVRVYNATNRTGLARAVASQLRKRGFGIMRTGNDPLGNDRQVEGVGELRYGQAGIGPATLVSLQFPGIQLAEDSRTSRSVDIAIGPDFRRLATTAEISKARKQLGARLRNSNVC